MKASETNLQGILNSPNQYIIPVFQRYYSWKKDNWDQLWNDITELSEYEDVSKRPSHFMGTLVFVPDEHIPTRVPAYQVIDGQQRLITLSLLLCALRNFAKSKGYESMANEIEKTFLIHEFKKDSEHFRVYPRHRDRSDYVAAITQEEEPKNRVRETLDYFYGQLSDTYDGASEENLKNFFSLLGARLEFVNITLARENPYRIFKSLNSTGIDLSEGDLIRNFVFMHVALEDQEEYDENFWKPLEEHFEDNNGTLDGTCISAFFRDFLMKDGNYVPVNQTFQMFEERYQDSGFNPKDLAKELTDYADLYDFIRGIKPHPDQSIETSLKKLRELGTTTTYPLLLTLLNQQKQGKLTAEQMTQAIELVSGFILRRYICSESSRAYSRWFVVVNKELADRPLDRLRLYLISKGFPGDDRFIPAFIRFGMYGTLYVRPILERLERSYGHKEPAVLEQTQIEHIMPQGLSSSWREFLGEEAKAIHEQWLHTIGNLTLSGYNPELSNALFEKKREEYDRSNITITRQLARYKTWSDKQIQERGEALAKIASEIWVVPTNVGPRSPGTGDLGGKGLGFNQEELEAVRRMLTRIPISRGQMALYEALYNTAENGLSKSQLAKAMDRTEDQVTGVLGALGVRINKTEGLDDNQGTSHILHIWGVGGEWHYKMKPVMRKALELEGVLRGAI